MVRVRVRPAGDAAFLLELPRSLDVATSAQIVALSDAVSRRFGRVVRDVVIGFHTLTVYFDPFDVDPRWLRSELEQIAAESDPADEPAGPLIDVPVCYDGDFAPDLAELAERLQLAEERIIELHLKPEYRVYMVGFVPGFAYMGILDEALADVPRRATPRTAVPAGSVAIAAGQTGIYPIETPGGWHLLGRTPIRPFDAARQQPVLFRVGDRVRFQRIDRAAYEDWSTT